MMDCWPFETTLSPLVGRAEELDRLADLVGLGRRAAAALCCSAVTPGWARAGCSPSSRDRAQARRAGGCSSGTVSTSATARCPTCRSARRSAGSPRTSRRSRRPSSRRSPAIARLLPARRLLADADDQAEPTDRAALFDAVHAALASSAATRRCCSSSRTCTGPTSPPASCSASCSPGSSTPRSPSSRPTAATTCTVATRCAPRSPSGPGCPRVARLHLDPLAERRPSPAGPRAAAGVAARARAAAHRRAGGGQPVLHRGAGRSRRGERRGAPDRARRPAAGAARPARRRTAGSPCGPPPWSAGGCPHDLLAPRLRTSPTASLDQALRAAVEANVLIAVGTDGYAFRHALLAEAVYQDLLPGERVRLHAAYAKALVAARGRRHRRRAGPACPRGPRPGRRRPGQRPGRRRGDGGRRSRRGHPALRARSRAARRPDVAAAVDRDGTARRSTRSALVAARQRRGRRGRAPLPRAGPRRGPAATRCRRTPARSTGPGCCYAVASSAHPRPTPSRPPGADHRGGRSWCPPSRRPRCGPSSCTCMPAPTSTAPAIDEAARWASEAQRHRPRAGPPDVAADAATTLARVDLRARAIPRPRSAALRRGRRGGAVAPARSPPSSAACSTSAACTTGWAGSPQALDAYQQACAAGRRGGPALGAVRSRRPRHDRVVAHVCGDWRLAVETLDVTGESPPEYGRGAAGIDRGCSSPPAGATEALDDAPRLRRWWRRTAWSPSSAVRPPSSSRSPGRPRRGQSMYDDVVASVAGCGSHRVPGPHPAAVRSLLGQLATGGAPRRRRRAADLARERGRAGRPTADVAATRRPPRSPARSRGRGVARPGRRRARPAALAVRISTPTPEAELVDAVAPVGRGVRAVRPRATRPRGREPGWPPCSGHRPGGRGHRARSPAPGRWPTGSAPSPCWRAATPRRPRARRAQPDSVAAAARDRSPRASTRS